MILELEKIDPLKMDYIFQALYLTLFNSKSLNIENIELNQIKFSVLILCIIDILNLSFYILNKSLKACKGAILSSIYFTQLSHIKPNCFLV